MSRFALPMTRKTRTAAGWVVVHPEGEHWRWLHAKPADGRTQVLACGSLPAPIGADGKLPEIAALARKGSHAVLTLSPGDYQLVQAAMPEVAPEELREALRWKVREMLDYPAENACLDYVEIPGDTSRSVRQRSAYVMCAQRDVLLRRRAALGKGAQALVAIDVPETAHRNLVAPHAVQGRGIALLGITPSSCLFSFVLEGELCMARRVDCGLDELMNADEARRERLFDRLLLEMQRSLDSYEREFHFASVSRVLIAPLPPGLGLAAWLSSNLYAAVEMLPLDEMFDFSAVPELKDETAQAAYLTLLGAGMRPDEV